MLETLYCSKGTCGSSLCAVVHNLGGSSWICIAFGKTIHFWTDKIHWNFYKINKENSAASPEADTGLIWD